MLLSFSINYIITNIILFLLGICKRITAVAQDIIPSPRHYPKPQSKLDNFIQVPIGHVYLEGDNPYNSTDSRTYGPVPVGLIKGKVICKLSLRDFPFIFSFISKYKPIYDDDGRLIPESPEEAEERTRNHENLMKIKRYNYNSFRYHLPSTTKNNENSTSNNEKETENTQNPSSESESSSSSTTPQPENVRPLPPSQLFNEENLFSQNDRLLNYIRDKSLIEAKINENKQRFYQYEDLVMKKLNEIESFQLLNSSEKKFRFKDNHIRLQNEKLKQLNESKTLENIQEEIIQKNKDITQLIIEQYSKEKSQQYLIHSNASSELDNKH